MKITENQMKEIEALIPDHAQALIAYGADMHCQGLIKGAVLMGMGVALGALSDIVISGIRKYRALKNNGKTNSKN